MLTPTTERLPMTRTRDIHGASQLTPRKCSELASSASLSSWADMAAANVNVAASAGVTRSVKTFFMGSPPHSAQDRNDRQILPERRPAATGPGELQGVAGLCQKCGCVVTVRPLAQTGDHQQRRMIYERKERMMRRAVYTERPSMLALTMSVVLAACWRCWLRSRRRPLAGTKSSPRCSPTRRRSRFPPTRPREGTRPRREPQAQQLQPHLLRGRSRACGRSHWTRRHADVQHAFLQRY